MQDFKVPPAWVEQGYSGEVVKQAILDEIDNLLNGVYASDRSMSGSNEDNTELLKELYLKKRRGLMDDYFYMTSAAVALNSLNYEEAMAWADSAATKFPNDKLTYYIRAEVYMTRVYNAKADSATTRTDKRLFVETMRRVSEPGRADQTGNLDETANNYLLGFYVNQNDINSLIELVERKHMEQTLNAPLNNALAYAYMSQKDYKKAEEALGRAVSQAGDVSNYWDSLAELYSIQGKDSLAVVHLAKALKSPKKSVDVSGQAYQADPRWQRLRKRTDFQQLLNRTRCANKGCLSDPEITTAKR